MDSQHVRPECDLVMKGGITSGVIYPPLVARLAKTYTFRCIGGTSAGAIAAGAAAAAQLGVRGGSNAEAFTALGQLPDRLGKPSSGAGAGSMLLNLFQPEREMRPHFRFLVDILNAKTKGGLFGKAALGLVRRFPFGALVGALPGSAILALSVGVAPTPLSIVVSAIATLLLIAGMLTGSLVMFCVTLAAALPRNSFGVCSGMPTGKKSDPALTSWLSGYLNELAGKPVGEPLTFGELWAGRLRAPTQPCPYQGKGRKEIELATMTTALNLGRPFRLPFESRDVYFRKSDMQRLFPVDVVTWLVDKARPSQTANGVLVGEEPLLALPLPEDLPVILAIRMSLSFPILLAAVPLYTFDRTQRADGASARVPTRVLFSDGGICSNFPIHFFDGPLPSRPTFGVNLEELRDDHQGQRVWLPPPPQSSRDVHTYVPTLSEQPGVTSILSFLGAIVTTMQCWKDQVQTVMPGFRERIVQIRHGKDEGGLNLNMEPEVINTLAKSGETAGETLETKFAPDATLPGSNAWDSHRWIRMRTFISGLEAQAKIVQSVMAGPQAAQWQAFMQGAGQVGFPFSSPAHQQLAKDVVDSLDKLGTNLVASGIELTSDAPRPAPEWRPTPRV